MAGLADSLIARSSLQVGGGITPGLTFNSRTGAGSNRDSNIYSQFGPVIIHSRYYYNNVYGNSWAAAKIIDIPINDQFTHWRAFEGSTEDNAAMVRAEAEHGIRTQLRRAQRAARLYGGAGLVLVTREGPLDSPLMVERLRSGDLTNMILLDRWDLTPIEWTNSLTSEHYATPSRFRATLRSPAGYREVEVDASRVLIFHGTKPPLPTTETDWDFWGWPVLISAMLSVMQNTSIVQAISHLVNEASTPIFKQHRFAKSLAQEGRESDNDYPSIETRLEAEATIRSIYRTTVIDTNDDFERVSVVFSGLPELIDKYAEQMAAAADIPITRFLGRSPAGMNATGVSDRQNYAAHIMSLQEQALGDPLMTLDRVLARLAGLSEPPKYHWLPAFSLSEQETVLVSERKARAVSMLHKEGIINGRFARQVLSGDDVFGDVPLEMEVEPLPQPAMGAGQQQSARPAPVGRS